MILFCGIPSEGPLALAIEAACNAGVKHVLFNQRYASYADMDLRTGNRGLSGVLRLGEAEYPLEAFTGVYTRMIEETSLPENHVVSRRKPDLQKNHRSLFVHRMLLEWIEGAACRVVNRARHMSSNGSKPFQAQAIAQVGFQTPPTLITNDPEEACEFINEHRRVIYKSISSIRSIVRECHPRTPAALARIRNLPTQFQAKISGTNVRVHVAGEAVFATEIQCDAVDYRYADRDGQSAEMRPVELPENVACRCRRLAKELHLPLCGIDLMRTGNGEYFCLEANPSPAYSYYQENTRQPIADALVKYLIGD
jgi:glutathione synthase/RimK-type ligase-like ATP-grasp enzyme